MVLPCSKLLTNAQMYISCFCHFSVPDRFINSAACVRPVMYLLLPPPPWVALGKSFILLDRRAQKLERRDLGDHQSRPFIISIRITAKPKPPKKLGVDQHTGTTLHPCLPAHSQHQPPANHTGDATLKSPAQVSPSPGTATRVNCAKTMTTSGFP